MYQGLIRTCSHPVVLETEEHPDILDTEEVVEQDKQQKVSYKDYLGLWTTLLDSASIKVNFTEIEMCETVLCSRELP